MPNWFGLGRKKKITSGERGSWPASVPFPSVLHSLALVHRLIKVKDSKWEQLWHHIHYNAISSGLSPPLFLSNGPVLAMKTGRFPKKPCDLFLIALFFQSTLFTCKRICMRKCILFKNPKIPIPKANPWRLSLSFFTVSSLCQTYTSNHLFLRLYLHIDSWKYLCKILALGP